MFLHLPPIRNARPAGLILLAALLFLAGFAAGSGRPGAFAAPAGASAGEPTAISAAGYRAAVLKVNDGDTFEARIAIWPGTEVTTKVRLRGIDTPEHNARCAEEYRRAGAAADALRALLAAGGVRVTNVSLDKYGGRVLADVATRATPDIAAALLQSGHARAYEGGRRATWCMQTSLR